MNSKPLPAFFRGLRAGLGGFRILAIVGVVLYPTLLVMLTLGIPGTPAVGLTTVHFDSKSMAVTATRGGEPAPLRLASVKGELELKENIPSRDPLYRVALQSSLAVQFGRAVIYLLVFHILFTICRNIEKGELFTERNFGLVRRLGVGMIALSIALALVNAWGTWRIDRYLADNIVFDGLKLSPEGVGPGFAGFLAAASHAGHVESFFFSGLIVLLVAEVFRQAVIIKQENDLTI